MADCPLRRELGKKRKEGSSSKGDFAQVLSKEEDPEKQEATTFRVVWLKLGADTTGGA